MSNKKKSIVSSIATITADGDFVVIEPFKGKILDLDLEAAQKLIEDTFELCDGKKRLILWDAREVEIMVRPEAREHFSTSPEAAQYRKALAFVVDSLANRLSANFFVKVNTPPAPAAVFESMEEAKAWLKSHA